MLTITATNGRIDAYLIPFVESKKVDQAERAARLKYSLRLYHSKPPTWLLNGIALGEEDERLLILSTIHALLADDEDKKETLKLRLQETSLTSAVQNLLHERHRLSSALIQQQEQIFNSVSRDLHDGIIGDLVTIMRSLSDKEVSANEVGAQLDDVVEDLRNICADLSSREIRDWGLQTALNQLCERSQKRCRNGAVKLDVQAQLNPLPYHVALQIYRIVQESINNAINHSNCKNVLVTIKEQDQQLFVTIQDDGMGMPVKMQKGRTGTGIAIMKERSRLIAAHGVETSFTISNQKQGCAVELVLDLNIR